MLPAYGGKCLSRKAVHNWVNDEVETEVRKWLRQQSKDFYAAGFDALVKRWDECINVGGGYDFSPGSNITYFTFYIHL
jgi:hypothetical protein